jgi:hypothetical protein
MYSLRNKQTNKKEEKLALTFASAAGFTFPNAKKAPPSMTTFFTLLAKEESLLIA